MSISSEPPPPETEGGSTVTATTEVPPGQAGLYPYPPNTLGADPKNTSYIHHLTKEKQLALKSLKTWMDESGFTAAALSCHGLHPDLTLLRFLRGDSFDLEKAKAHICKCIEWRTEKGVDQVSRCPPEETLAVQSLKDIMKALPHWQCGFDKLGCPVVYRQFGNFDTAAIKKITSFEQVFRYHAYEQEAVTRICTEQSHRMQAIVETVTSIVDIDNMRLSQVNSDFMFLIKTLAQIDQVFYPETAQRIIIINTPSAFPIVWRLVKAFLHPITAAKFTILGGRKDFEPFLQKIIGEDNLPANYGGLLPPLTADTHPYALYDEFVKNSSESAAANAAMGDDPCSMHLVSDDEKENDTDNDSNDSAGHDAEPTTSTETASGSESDRFANHKSSTHNSNTGNKPSLSRNSPPKTRPQVQTHTNLHSNSVKTPPLAVSVSAKPQVYTLPPLDPQTQPQPQPQPQTRQSQPKTEAKRKSIKPAQPLSSPTPQRTKSGTIRGPSFTESAACAAESLLAIQVKDREARGGLTYRLYAWLVGGDYSRKRLVTQAVKALPRSTLKLTYQNVVDRFEHQSRNNERPSLVSRTTHLGGFDTGAPAAVTRGQLSIGAASPQRSGGGLNSNAYDRSIDSGSDVDSLSMWASSDDSGSSDDEVDEQNRIEHRDTTNTVGLKMIVRKRRRRKQVHKKRRQYEAQQNHNSPELSTPITTTPATAQQQQATNFSASIISVKNESDADAIFDRELLAALLLVVLALAVAYMPRMWVPSFLSLICDVTKSVARWLANLRRSAQTSLITFYHMTKP